MGVADMGRVPTEATIYNLGDLHGGAFVRTVAVSDAVVDERIAFMTLPRDLIEQLGLGVRLTSWAGLLTAAIRVEIMGREATGEARVVAAGEPVRVGCGVLTWMDWVIDMTAKKLIGNPAHGGEHILEVL